LISKEVGEINSVPIRTNLWNRKGRFMMLKVHEHITARYIYKAVNGLRI